jgi:hypothetical protein
VNTQDGEGEDEGGGEIFVVRLHRLGQLYARLLSLQHMHKAG